MNKAVFLDRDGTINIDYGYVHKIEDFKFKEGVLEGLKELSKLGYLLIIVTNQSGIGRGYYRQNDFKTLNNYMLDLFKKENVDISKVYYCPHIDKDNCECRKPKLKLFYEAKKEFNIDFSKSYAIGDNPRDLAVCEKEKVKGILLEKKDQRYKCVSSFKEATDYIKSMG